MGVFGEQLTTVQVRQTGASGETATEKQQQPGHSKKAKNPSIMPSNSEERRAILLQMRLLMDQLEKLELSEDEPDQPRSSNHGSNEPPFPSKGCRVLITRNDKFQGRKGTIEGPCGETGKYWDIKLDACPPKLRSTVIHRTETGFIAL